MRELLNALRGFVSAKGIIVLGLAVLLALAIFWKPQRKQGVDRTDGKAADDTVHASVFTVEAAQIAPVAFKMPVYFLIGIKNVGAHSDTLDVWVDLGRAQLVALELRPNADTKVQPANPGESTFRLRYLDVPIDATVYFYAQITAPTFEKVVYQPSHGSSAVIRMNDVAHRPTPFIMPWMVWLMRIAVVIVGFFVFLVAIYIVRGIPSMLKEPN